MDIPLILVGVIAWEAIPNRLNEVPLPVKLVSCDTIPLPPPLPPDDPNIAARST